MRISSNTPASETPAPQRAAASGPAAPEASREAPQGSTPASTLQSAVLQPALAALHAMPELDHARVAALRDALAKGELPFDAAKLAGLIQRFHGGRS